ncbi:MAG: polysaccharide biosynthesis tyrosine autokinase [Zetaproteobacteria bacterium]|nr:polysaccharide biosynthesis tyrosine autokinase [Zetaproteobacteria bacterium]
MMKQYDAIEAKTIEQPVASRRSMIDRGRDVIEDEIDLTEYIGVLIQSRWLIVAVAVVILGLGAAYAFFLTPIYQADVLIQVESKGSSNPLGNLGELTSIDSSTSSEVEIIKSRSVIGKVVSDLGLDVSVYPDYFPYFGGAFSRRYVGDGFAKPFLGLDHFAWGGEKIAVSTVVIPEGYVGRLLTIVAGEAGHYELFDEEDHLLLDGVVGQTVVRDGFELFVRELIARPGTHFNLQRRSWANQINAVLNALEVSTRGKDSGMLQLLYSGPDPYKNKVIVDKIANVYLTQNVERKSEEAQRALDFIADQLPALKADMQAAESRMNDYKLKKGSVNLSIETQSVLSRVVEFEKQRSSMAVQRAELSKKFTAQHPVMTALDAREAQLNAEQSKLEKVIQTLPQAEQEMLQYSRDVSVNQSLYTFLLNKGQELKVAKAATIGDVRILDFAVLAEEPIKPNRKMIMAVAGILGLFLGVLIAFVRKAMHKGIEDPEVVEAQLGLSVYAGIPHSDVQNSIYDVMRKLKGQEASKSLLALVNPNDMAIESLRSLRTNLHFGLLEAKNNIVMITGPAPNIGKSFVSVNFSEVLAHSGQKVLLIDADMRKGHLHEYVGGHRDRGLSDVLSGSIAFEDAVQTFGDAKFSLLSTGTIPPNPSELLMHAHFVELLHKVSALYDLVLIDTPPVLAATDAAIIGKHVGTAFMLIRAGRHTMRELQQSVRQLDHAGVYINGAIFNDIPPKAGYGYGYGYGYKYGYHYQYDYQKSGKA